MSFRVVCMKAPSLSERIHNEAYYLKNNAKTEYLAGQSQHPTPFLADLERTNFENVPRMGNRAFVMSTCKGRQTLDAYLLHPRIRLPYFQKSKGLKGVERCRHCHPKSNPSKKTHAGHPIATATKNNTVFPIPYPKDLYIAGAKRGKPNPAIDLSVPTAARADAA